jgi:hypothetical protein
MRLKLIAIAILAFAGTVSAQEPWAQRPDERQEVVLNEDGGRAFIVRPSSTTFNRVIKPGGTHNSGPTTVQRFSGKWLVRASFEESRRFAK